MLFRLIRKEILAHILSLRFAATFMLLFVLVFAGVYVSVNEHRQEVEQYNSLARENRRVLSDILAEEDWGAQIGRLFFGGGKRDAVPVSSLSWLGRGLESAYPASLITQADGATRNVGRGAVRNPLLGTFPIPDFVYIVNVVLSLLAVLFMFDAVCGEKESGTLRLVLSNAVPRHLVLLGKAIGGYVILIVPFLLAAAGGLVYAVSRGVFSAAQVPRVLVLIFAACLYIAVFFNLGLFVSAKTGRSSTALLVCLLVWVVSILAVPNIAPVTAKILEPTPSPEKIRSEKEAVDREINLKMRRLTLASGELDYGKKVEEAREDLQRERERRKLRWDRYYEERQRRQNRLAETIGRLSPSASWTYAAVALTGTGPRNYESFQRGRKKLAAEFGKLWDDHRAGMRRRRGERGERTPIVADQLPHLRIDHPDSRAAVGEALNDILILVILNVAFFMLAFLFFLRYDVR